MAILDDSDIPQRTERFELVRRAGRRRITHAFHDVDGTHSRIRDWPPVMSRCLHYAMTCGLGEDFDSSENLPSVTDRVGVEPLEETDRFCVESAGLSAITQMEWAIRRAVQGGCVPRSLELSDEQRAANDEIVRRIWAGQERYGDLPRAEALQAFIDERAPRLFQFYEQVLNAASRDRNTAAARRDPAAWRFPGSLEFLERLRACGCVNYMVTGTVIYEGGGMLDEVRALDIEIGPGRLVEALHGSAWDRKIPKDELMGRVMRELGVRPEHVLVVGDGRKEIEAGAAMGCVVLSRLDAAAARPRQMHRELGAHYIVTDYTDPVLRQLIREDD
ncbi:MAG: hypothetical protein BIFFINMI_02103 [Phycisphaerae bacterium]|nr:hypothetical protein [Phycisphaerae bacterium]